MDIFSPVVGFPSSKIALHTAATSNGNSAAQAIADKKTLALQVSGEWTGLVTVSGQITGTSNYVRLPIFGLNGAPVPAADIKANGLYYVEVAGYSGFRTRVEPASGAVTVDGVLSHGSPIRGAARYVELARVAAQPIAAGAHAYVVSDLDVTAYAYLRVSFRANSTGLYTVRYEPRAALSTYGGPEGFIDVISQTLRGTSELIELRGPTARFNIKNDADSERSFDFALYGIR